MECLVVSVCANKGGTAKSTSVMAMASVLAGKGKRVLVVDTDSQHNLSTIWGFNPDKMQLTLFEVMMGSCKAEEAICSAPIDGVDIIVGSPEMANLDIAFASKFRREYILESALNPLKERYDFILIDTPPSLGLIIHNVLMASSGIVIPSEAEICSLKGIDTFCDLVDMIKDVRPLKVYGVLLTRVERLASDKIMLDNAKLLCSRLGTKLFDTTIRSQKNVKEARMLGKDVVTYSSEIRKKGKQDAGSDYERFVEEFLADIGR